MMLPVMLVMIVVSSWLLVCELPMFALKFKHWGWNGNEVKYSFAVLSLIAILVFGPLDSFWAIILVYIVVSAALKLTGNNVKSSKPIK